MAVETQLCSPRCTKIGVVQITTDHHEIDVTARMMCAFGDGAKRKSGLDVCGIRLERFGKRFNQAGAEFPIDRRYVIGPVVLLIADALDRYQAFAWSLAALPYADAAKAQLVLQDFDRIAASNDSTSLLSFIRDIGRRKGRVVADWLEARGFETFIEERRFGEWTRRSADEPGVALCGVDNALARAALEYAGFDIIIEAGLGAGPEAFRSIAMHTFPGTRRAKEIWSRHVGESSKSFETMPAYQRLKEAGMESCGLTQLASRTVGVPFVGLIAGCLVISELLRRLHGGTALEFAAGSVSALQDIETGTVTVAPYAHGHVTIR